MTNTKEEFLVRDKNERNYVEGEIFDNMEAAKQEVELLFNSGDIDRDSEVVIYKLVPISIFSYKLVESPIEVELASSVNASALKCSPEHNPAWTRAVLGDKFKKDNLVYFQPDDKDKELIRGIVSRVTKDWVWLRFENDIAVKINASEIPYYINIGLIRAEGSKIIIYGAAVDKNGESILTQSPSGVSKK